MRLLKYFYILVIFLPVSASAQIDYDVTGYAVDLPIYQRTNETLSDLLGIDKNNLINISRIRIKPQFYIGDNSRINLEYEVASIYFNSPSRFYQITNRMTNRQILDLSWNFVKRDKFRINHFIDRLYFRHGFTFGNITVGRQRISWGTGRIWNPTDLFNPINPTNFSKIEKDGADAVSFTWNIGNFTDLELVYNPVNQVSLSDEDTNIGARFRTNFGEYDVSVMAGSFDDNRVAGLDFAGNLFDAGVRGEGIYNFGNNLNTGEDFIKFILGLDYQFTPELYALMEYQYNGEGKTNKSRYEFERMISGEIINLNRNYICLSASYLAIPLLNLSLTNTFNLNDKSGYISLTGTYSLKDNFDASAGLQTTFGDNFTEYWLYPSSLYLKCDYYF